MANHDGKVVISTLLDNGGLEKGIKNISGKLGGLTKVIAAASAAVIAAVTKQAVDAYADYEQLIGGVETMFKDSAGKVKQYAEDAFYTAGVSANEYMQTVTSFSASLISSLAGDTAAAADVANMAIVDMSDNVNKMGTDMTLIQNAYQGFAKQNYTMLDNLKLGYSGTKTEMERLLKDAQKISGIKYNISNLADVYSAIHVIQEELGIAGTTAKEAEKTITGSANMTKAAWKNVLTAIAGGGDLDKAINNLVYSISKYFENIVPVVERAISGIGVLIERIAPQLVQAVAAALIKAIPSLLSAVYQMIAGLASGIFQGIVALFTGGGASTKLSAQLNDVQAAAGGAADAEQDLADGISSASRAAKQSLAGFDELNKLQDNAGGVGGSSAGANATVSVDTTATPGEGVDTEGLSTAAGYIKDIAEYVPVITAAIGGWKLGSFITDLVLANTEAATLKETLALLGRKLTLTVGITLAVTGIALETKGIVSTIKEGLNKINASEIAGGGANIIAGGALIGKAFSNSFLGAAIGGIVAGVGMVFAGVWDAVANELDWLNALMIGGGTTVIGASIGGIISGPLGALVGAGIGLIAGMISDALLLITQSWHEIASWCADARDTVQEWLSNSWADTAGWCADVRDKIGEWMAQVVADVVQWGKDAWQGVVNVWSDISGWFDTNVIQPVGKFFSSLWSNVKNWAVNAWKGIASVFSTIGSWFDTNIIRPVGQFFTNLWSGFTQGARNAWSSTQNVFSTVGSFFSNTFSKAWAGIVKVFSVGGQIFVDIKNGILTAFKTIVNGLISGLNKVIKIPFDGINWALSQIRSVDIAGVKPFSWIKTITVPQIPYLAQGAVLPPNKPFMAVVGDQRHGTNIEAPLATIQEAVALVMADYNAANMAGLEAIVALLRDILEAILGIQIGDDVITAAVLRHQAKMAVVRGGNA